MRAGRRPGAVKGDGGGGGREEIGGENERILIGGRGGGRGGEGVEELSCGGGKRSNLVMVGVGGPYDNHHHIVSFATSYGDAERETFLAR